MKITVTSFKRSQTMLHSVPLTLQQASTISRLCQRLLDTHGKVWISLLWGSLLLSPGSWCTQGSVCGFQESVSPVLCKFWQLSGGVNGDLLLEGLGHTQVCCTQSPCPCGRPPLTCTFARDSQAQLCLCLLGSLGPAAHKVCLSTLSISGWYRV